MPNFKMTRILTTILFLIIALNSFGQIITVDTLFIDKGEKSAKIQKKDKLKFPLIRTGNIKTDSLINKDLKNRFTNNEYPDLPTDSTIIKWGDGQIINLDFEVTYIKNGLVSLNISSDGCGAYCTSWTDYYTYSVTTGKYITINEIIDTTGKFRTVVISDKDKQYDEQRAELKKMLLNKESGLDEGTYKWAIENYGICDSSFEFNSFALYIDHLEIIAKCYLPNAIKNLKPIIELKYKYVDIAEYLKTKN